MSKREKIHVVPTGNGDWGVKKEGGQRSSRTFENKKDAVDYAKDRAKSAPTGQVIIHKKDGKIQTEHTYGKDPHPPKG